MSGRLLAALPNQSSASPSPGLVQRQWWGNLEAKTATFSPNVKQHCKILNRNLNKQYIHIHIYNQSKTKTMWNNVPMYQCFSVSTHSFDHHLSAPQSWVNTYFLGRLGWTQINHVMIDSWMTDWLIDWLSVWVIAWMNWFIDVFLHDALVL